MQRASVTLTKLSTYGQLYCICSVLVPALSSKLLCLHSHLGHGSGIGSRDVRPVHHDDLHTSARFQVRIEATVPAGIKRVFPLFESEFAILALNGLLDVHRTERTVGFGVVHDRLQELDSQERHDRSTIKLAPYVCALSVIKCYQLSLRL